MKRFAGDSLFSLFTSFYNENWLKLVSFIVLNQRVFFRGVGGGVRGTPLYKPTYVTPHWVGFSRHFGLKTGIYFAHSGLKSVMVFWGNYESV